MRHPFDGINAPGLTRRGALGALAAAAAGLVGLSSSAAAKELQEIATTDALQEEGAIGGGVQVTTLAVGEEGGQPMTQAKGEEGAKAVTTEPFGEEAGKVTSHAVPGVEDGMAAATEAKGENGGGVGATTLAFGEEGGGPTTKALGEEGGGIATKAKNEGGIGAPVVPVSPASVELKDEVLKGAWKDLGSKDAAVGVQGCAVLYGAKNGVTFLKDNLNPKNFVSPPPGDEKKIAELIVQLDADNFKKRTAASDELEKIGASALPQLEEAVKAPKSAEQRMRLETLISKAKDGSPTVQGKRALEVLVALRTPAAKELLTTLSKGDEKEWLTKAAKEALDKLPK